MKTVFASLIIAGLSLTAPEARAQELLPHGAEAAGNKAGTIPAWENANSISSTWTYGKNRGEHFKYKDDKPLFVIDESNADQYKEQLTPGQYDLLKKRKGYTMPVYPSRRVCTLPKSVLENSSANAGYARIGPDGWSLERSYLPGVPFPVPKSGLEAMWNAIVRYQGLATDYKSGTSFLAAPPGSGSQPVQYRWSMRVWYPGAKEGRTDIQQLNNLLTAFYYAYSEPAALSGQAMVSRTYIGRDGEAFYYFPGQRRVRRLPNYAYDAPLLGFENQIQADQQNLFFGNPDRFNWKLVGKKEIFVPYNNFAMGDNTVPLEQAMGETFINPKQRRYELHRVWVVDGTLKEDTRHLVSRKTFYLDEDTWTPLAGDDYASDGALWKVKEGFIMPIAELNGACVSMPYVIYDTQSGRYVADALSFGSSKDAQYYAAPTQDKMFKDDFYTSDNLSRMSGQ